MNPPLERQRNMRRVSGPLPSFAGQEAPTRILRVSPQDARQRDSLSPLKREEEALVGSLFLLAAARLEPGTDS